MRTFISALFHRKPRTTRKPLPRRRPDLERLEDRLAPTANILVSLDGSYPQQLLREYTPGGTLVRSVVVPPGGAAENARDLAADAAGNVLVYNGTFDPYLSTYNPAAGTWAHRTHSGWSTVNNTTYGGIGLWNSYVFVTDMTTYGESADAAKGIVRFNQADGTSTRFADTLEFIDLTVGQDGLVYALNTFRQVFVYNPETMALQRTLTLPTSVGGVVQFYHGLAVNAAGEIFAAGGSARMVHRFSASGTLLQSVTLTGPGGGPYYGWVHDIDVSTDNRLVLGTTSGHVVQMTAAFTDVTWLSVSNTTIFVAYGLDTGAPPPPPPAPTLSINDVSVTEGNSGTVNAVFTITLSQASTQTVQVNYVTTASSAAAGADYQSTSGTLTFTPGQTSKTVAVAVLGDVTDENNEIFFLDLSSPVNATLGDWYGVGTIVDNDTSSLAINDVSVTEGNSGSTAATFTVSLSVPNSRTVTVSWATAAGTATAGSDFATASGALTFNPGETSKTVTVSVLGDTAVESSETFFVNLSNPSNAVIGDGQGAGTILNDDNGAPTANAGPDRTADEGSTVPFDGLGSSDPDGHALTYLWDFGDGSTGSGATTTHVYADNGDYTVTLTVNDGFGGSSSDTALVTVLNVAPTAHVEQPSNGVRGQDRVFRLSTGEPSSADRAAPMTYVIAWGDGATQTVTGPSGFLEVGHVYTAAGAYTVSVTATDKDGGTGPATNVLITIAAAEMQGGDLYVGGTTANDLLTVLPVGGGAVRVELNGADLGTFTLGWVSAPGNGAVIVYAQAGDDTVLLVGVDDGSGTPTFPFGAALFGGDGNDTLDARAANGQILQHGGSGDDVLWGGRGGDLLVGGTGLDWLYGGAGEDLLIGGSTIFDNDFIALASLSGEWVRTDADFATRVAHLKGELWGGYNGDRYLTALTVLDDGVADELFGGAGADWFFLTGGGGGALDHANDADGGDLVTVV